MEITVMNFIILYYIKRFSNKNDKNAYQKRFFPENVFSQIIENTRSKERKRNVLLSNVSHTSFVTFDNIQL